MDYNARYYDVALGRFVSADTIIPDTANPQDWNRYAYVRNSPVVLVDATGHAPNTRPMIDGECTPESCGKVKRHTQKEAAADVEPASSGGDEGMPSASGTSGTPLITVAGRSTARAATASRPAISRLGTTIIVTPKGSAGVINRSIAGGSRSLFFDVPHSGANYLHFNADIGALKHLDYQAVNPSIHAGATGTLDFLGQNGSRMSKGLFVLAAAWDGYDLGSSVVQDYNSTGYFHFGPETQRATGRVAGGWAGAYAGAAIGSAVCPGPGTIIGGIAGGICGSYLGECLVPAVAENLVPADGYQPYQQSSLEDDWQSLRTSIVSPRDMFR